MQGFTLEFRQLLIMQTYVCKTSSEAFDLQIQFFNFNALFASFQIGIKKQHANFVCIENICAISDFDLLLVYKTKQ